MVIRWLWGLLLLREKETMCIPSASFLLRKLFWKPYPVTSASHLLARHMITTSPVPGWERYAVDRSEIGLVTRQCQHRPCSLGTGTFVLTLSLSMLTFYFSSLGSDLSWSRSSLILCRWVGFSDFQFTCVDLPGSLSTVSVLLLPPALNQPHFLSTHFLLSLLCSVRSYL